MSESRVHEYLKAKGYADRITIHDELIDTVEHAAQVIGVSEGQIAKTLSFLVDDRPVLIVMAGDVRVNGGKFKHAFGSKPHMIPRDQVEELIGHAPGGVCPFAVKDNVEVYLDASLKRFDRVYPAAGDSYSSAVFTIEELKDFSNAKGIVDVCKEETA